MQTGRKSKTSLNCAALNFHELFHLEVLQSVVRNTPVERLFLIHGQDYMQHSTAGKIILDELSRLGEAHSSIDFVYREQIQALERLNDQIEIPMPPELSNVRSMFYKICDRSGVFGLSSEEKEKFLLILTTHFSKIMKKYQFNLVIAIDTPHSFFSYLFYALLVHKKIKVIRIENHFLQDTSICVDQTGLPHAPVDYLEGISAAMIRERLSPELLRKLDGQNSYLDSWVAKETRKAAGTSWLRKAMVSWRYGKAGVKNIAMGILPFLFKKHGHGIAALHPPMSAYSFRRQLNKILGKQYQLLRHYISLTEDPDFGSKFIFFALHMQPEKTSMPLAKEFSDQLHAAKILVASLPTGWQLYIKEHPNQFNPTFPANSKFRSKQFYLELSSMPQVKLIAQDVPSKKLVLSSQIVATLTGSVGWEALRLGKPVIAFGESYYSGCSACA